MQTKYRQPITTRGFFTKHDERVFGNDEWAYVWLLLWQGFKYSHKGNYAMYMKTYHLGNIF